MNKKSDEIEKKLKKGYLSIRIVREGSGFRVNSCLLIEEEIASRLVHKGFAEFIPVYEYVDYLIARKKL